MTAKDVRLAENCQEYLYTSSQCLCVYLRNAQEIDSRICMIEECMRAHREKELKQVDQLLMFIREEFGLSR